MKQHKTILFHVEGMRALAVIAVIINHLWHNALPGGYLGVDIFFVISGFVITKSMMGRTETSIMSGLAQFYVRRIKRIMPALVLMVLVTLPLLQLVNPATQSSAGTGVGALFGASNIFLYLLSADYFGAAITLNPFMHTWSLGIEEQFYFIFPIVFFFLAKRKSDYTTLLLILIGITSLLSALAYAMSFHSHTSAAYYLLPFRAWELGVGCSLAILPTLRERVKPALQILAALLITFAFIIGDTTPVISTFAAVFGSAALICAGDRKSVLNVILQLPVVQYIGKISYSLYLWHWPVICLFIWTLGVSLATVLPILLLTTFFAAASFHILETPARKATWFGKPALTIGAGLAIASIASLMVVGMSIAKIPAFSGTQEAVDITQDGFTARVTVPGTGRAIVNCLGEKIGADSAIAQESIETCTATSSSPTQLVFFGDSHSLDMFGVAEILHREDLATVINFGQPGCRAPRAQGEPDHCDYVQTVLDVLETRTDTTSNEPTWIVLRSILNPRAIDGSLANYTARIDTFVADAERRGFGVVYVAPSPHYKALGEGGLCVEQWFRPAWAFSERCTTGFKESRQEQLARRVNFYDALLELEADHNNLVVFDPFETLCGPDPDHCSALHDGVVTYRDPTHLTNAGADLLAAAFIEFLSTLNSYELSQSTQ